jgi:HEAT repeat protein
MTIKTVAVLAMLALAGSAKPAGASLAAPAVGFSIFEDAADSLFQLGRQAINDERYEQAANVLRQLVERYPSSTRAGEALYWRAWAQYQLGMDRHNKAYLDMALQAIDQLQSRFARSRNVADARELRSRILAAQANLGDSHAAGQIAADAKRLRQAGACSTGDDEMRMAALQGLISMNASDAVPILKQVLAQRDPCRAELRRQAVYLLTQRKGDDVVNTLVDVARNDPSNDVQSDAVYWLSTTHSDRAAAALDSILFQGRDNDIRLKSVYALSQVGTDKAVDALRRAVQDNKIPEEIRANAIYWLGDMKRADLAFFRSVFQSTQSNAVRQQVMMAVVALKSPAATQWLIDMAKDKSVDADSRKNAIYWVSQTQAVDMDQLNAIYDAARGDNAIQSQVIYALSTRKEPAAVDKLMAIAKSDGSIDMRKSALYWLGTKNDPRVQQFLRDLLK